MVSTLIRSLLLLLICGVAQGQNFITYQSTDAARAQKIVDRAEECRRLIALAWFGEELPPWSRPCVMTWYTNGTSGGGETSYMGVNGTEPIDMKMKVLGRWENLMDDVIPHEVFHLVFASKIGAHPPRWMDEGAASTTETDRQITLMEDTIVQRLRSAGGFKVNELMQMREYPRDMWGFYVQSVSMSRFLIGKRGPQPFVNLAIRQRQLGSWTNAMREIYGYDSLSAFQNDWLQWVQSGSPNIERDADLMASLKPIPRGQAPFRPTDQIAADMQFAAANCPPQQQPQTTLQPPANTPPTSQPLQQQVKIEVDYEKLAAELAKIPDVRGPAGQDGVDGMNGKDCELGPEQVQQLVDMTIQSITPALQELACKCDPNTRGCDCSDHDPEQPPPQPVPDGGNSTGGDCECTDEQMDEIARRAAAILKASMPPTDAENRVLYFTSDSCKECGRANELIQKLKNRGAPITVIKLSERDAETRGVPMIFIPKTERRIVGLANVISYLSTVTY